jgi:transposase InsO family protein
LVTLGFVQSMNRPREVTDNAHVESFPHSMKRDVVHGNRFRRQADRERLVHSYMPYYNGVRLHSGIGYSSPVAFEDQSK